MNVLQQAFNAISSLFPTSQITITNARSEIINGVDFKKSVTIVTTASVQQLKPQEVQSHTTYTDSTDYRRFFILGDDCKIVSSALSLTFTSSEIEYDNRIYNVYYKEDWSANGWVICDAVCVGLK